LIKSNGILNKYVVGFGRVLVAHHCGNQEQFPSNEVRLYAVSFLFLKKKKKRMPLPSFTQLAAEKGDFCGLNSEKYVIKKIFSKSL